MAFSNHFPPAAGRMTVSGCFFKLVMAMLVFAIFDGLLFGVFDRGAIFWSVVDAPMPPHGVFWYATIGLFALMCRFWKPPALAVSPSRLVVLGGGLAIICVILIGAFALASFPNSGDEYAYVFQSLTYRAGRISNPPPLLGQLMAVNYTWVTATSWVGQYSPGWPLMMLMAILIGLPGWVINLPLLAITLWLLFDLLKRHADQTIAALVSCMFALCPFTLFNAASFFPHLFAASLLVFVYWAHDREIARSRSFLPVMIGIALGLLGITRSVDAVAATPVLIDFVRRKDRSLLRFFWIALGGLPFLMGFLWYQCKITGNFFTPIYYLGGRTLDHLYFDKKSIEVGIFLNFSRFREFALWGSPLVVPVWIVSFVLKAFRRALIAPDFVFPVAFLLFALYPYTGGNRYGPRYFFEFWPMMLFTIATAYHFFDIQSRKLAYALLVVSPLYGIVTSAFVARAYHDIVAQRNDIYERSQHDITGRAIVCFSSSVGPSLPLLPMDLVRNGIDSTGRILYAFCGNVTPAQLHAAYPSRQILFYRWNSTLGHGVIGSSPG